MSGDGSSFYARQQILPEIGLAGQARLKLSRALVVGAGGLGAPVLSYLAGAGVGQIDIVDDDKVHESNLHRQVIYSMDDIGKNKAEAAQSQLQKKNPYISTRAISDRLALNNVQDLVGQADIVFDCSDNFSTKFLLHDTCFKLKKNLVLASIYQWEGQLQVFSFSKKTDQLIESEEPCFRCLWPEEPNDGCVGTCVDSGVLGAVAGTMGILQSLEGLKLLLGLDTIKQGESVIFDLKQFSMKRLKWRRLNDCKLCGGQMNEIQTPAAPEFEYHIQDSFPHLDKAFWVDIRSHQELIDKPFDFGPNFLHMPMDEFDAESFDSSKNQYIIIVCDKGIRSLMLTQQLRSMGYHHFYSYAPGVSGKIAQLNKEI